MLIGAETVKSTLGDHEMPLYTATIRRSVTVHHREMVELAAEDDAEANRKLRDLALTVTDVVVVPDSGETVGGVQQAWVNNDDRATMTLYRSDLEGARFLNQPLDDEIWEDLRHTMENHLSLMDIAYSHLRDQWDIGPGYPPP